MSKARRKPAPPLDFRAASRQVLLAAATIAGALLLISFGLVMLKLGLK